MARGHPDYSNPLYSLASKNIDFNTLVLAVGGISSVDGRGRFVWYDNFDNGILGWEDISAGNAASPVATVLYNEQSPISAYFDTVDTAVLSWSMMRRLILFPGVSRVGVQFSVRLGTATGLASVGMYYHANDYSLSSGVHLNSETGKISITYPLDDSTDVLDFDYSDVYPTFMQVKMVVDFEEARYHRLVVGNTELDLTDYTIEPGSYWGTNMIYLILAAGHNGDDPFTCHFGHVLITADEP